MQGSLGNLTTWKTGTRKENSHIEIEKEKVSTWVSQQNDLQSKLRGHIEHQAEIRKLDIWVNIVFVFSATGVQCGWVSRNANVNITATITESQDWFIRN